MVSIRGGRGYRTFYLLFLNKKKIKVAIMLEGGGAKALMALALLFIFAASRRNYQHRKK